MDYSIYNDYELLYLIQEGVEPALNLLHKKYSHLIYSTAKSFYPEGIKLEDLVQEGRIVLQSCIYSYSSFRGVSFYSFFLLCYKRRIYKLLQDEYFHDYLQLEENFVDRKYSSSIYVRPELLFQDEEDIRMYKEILLDGITITEYSKIHNQSYMTVYRKYVLILEKIKRWISK